MSLADSVIKGGCYMCDIHKEKLKELEAQLEAVREFGEKLAGGHVSGTWQGRVKAELDRILKGGD